MNRNALIGAVISLVLPLAAMAQAPSTDSSAQGQAAMKTESGAAKVSKSSSKKGTKKVAKKASPRNAKVVRSTSTQPVVR